MNAIKFETIDIIYNTLSIWVVHSPMGYLDLIKDKRIRYMFPLEHNKLMSNDVVFKIVSEWREEHFVLRDTFVIELNNVWKVYKYRFTDSQKLFLKLKFGNYIDFT